MEMPKKSQTSTITRSTILSNFLAPFGFERIDFESYQVPRIHISLLYRALITKPLLVVVDMDSRAIRPAHW